MEDNPCTEMLRRSCCYSVPVQLDSGEHVFARVHGEEPTDPKSREAIAAVIKAAYAELDDSSN